MFQSNSDTDVMHMLVCMQKRNQTDAEEAEDNSDEEVVINAEEGDSIGNASAVEDESVVKSDVVDEDMPLKSKSETDVTTYQRGNKKRSRDQADTALTKGMKEISTLVNASTKVMKQVATSCDEKKQHQLDEDKDWIFAKLIFKKMKEIPDGLEKDDLQVEIQKLINDTRRRNYSCHMSHTTWPATMTVNQYTTPGQVQPQCVNQYVVSSDQSEQPNFCSTGASYYSAFDVLNET